MSGLTEEQTQQILNAEKQLMSERQQFKNYAQARLILASNEEKFRLSLKELESAGERPCFQPLGKAYLMRPKADLVSDFTHLVETNKKEQEESNVNTFTFLPNICLTPRI